MNEPRRIPQNIKVQVVGTTTVILENGDVIVLQVQAQKIILVEGKLDARSLQACDVEPGLMVGRPE